MKIKIYYSDTPITHCGETNPGRLSTETLRWTTNHPQSSYGLGVLIRGSSRDILDGMSFALMVGRFGAWIETDSEETSAKVRDALVTAVTGTAEFIKVAKA